jgi:hypothetical protein
VTQLLQLDIAEPEWSATFEQPDHRRVFRPFRRA